MITRCSAGCAACCDGQGTPAGCACRCPGWHAESRRRLEDKLGRDARPRHHLAPPLQLLRRLRTTARAARLLQLQRSGLDLPNSLARQGELLADFLKRVVGVHADASACVRCAPRGASVKPARALRSHAGSIGLRRRSAGIALVSDTDPFTDALFDVTHQASVLVAYSTLAGIFATDIKGCATWSLLRKRRRRDLMPQLFPSAVLCSRAGDFRLRNARPLGNCH